LFPPVGNVRQIDPKTPGIPWLEGNQLNIRIADPKALVERFNVEQRDMGGDAAKNSHLLPLKLGKPRILRRSTQAHLDALKLLQRDFPHFQQAIECLHLALHARYLCSSPATFRPILLVGGAGLGKTEFMSRVARVLGLQYRELNSTANDPLALSGLSPPWRNCRPGLIANVFKLGDSDDEDGDGNPIILIDELDKASTMGQSSEVSSSAGIFEQLLGVLEPGSGGTFTDSYLGSDLKLHCNYVNWVFGANETSRIPTYFLSRLTVISIPHPSKNDLREGLVDSVYRGVLEKVPYAPFFVKQLSQEVVDLLSESGMTPREIRQLIESSLEKCMSKFAAPPELNSIWLLPDDLSLKCTQIKRRSIGFISDTEVAS
jgi:ATP-dependent Lon protease